MREKLRQRPWLLPMVAFTLVISVVSAGLPAFTTSPLTTGRGEIRLYLDVLEENNLPTWWATTVLVLAAAGWALVAAGNEPGRARRRSTLLAVLIALLSLDEMTSLHERLDRLVAGRLDLGSYPFLWVVPGAVLGLLVFTGVASMVGYAPREVRAWLLIGFGLLLASALGGELVQGLLLGSGSTGPAYVLTYHAEEAGETLGAIALFTAAVRMLALGTGNRELPIRVLTG